ncbi:MAG TPA: N-acetyltransferase [Candidatus Obscuribacterales bacterium]
MVCEMTFHPDQLQLRSERASDESTIASLLDAAFDGRLESELVSRIRQTPEYINDLTLVAEASGEIVGFNMVSYVYLKLSDGERQAIDANRMLGAAGSEPDDADLQANDAVIKVLSLGPVAVAPARQKQGIGGRLMEECIEIANQRNEALIVLLGHAEYFPRFGFERASVHGIYPPVAWPDESYMIFKLRNYSPQMRGTILYPVAWQIGEGAEQQ